MERRDFLKVTGLGVAGASLAACARSIPQPLSSMAHRPGQKPKNIIFMCSDGMSAGVPSMAEAFANRYKGRRTRWAELFEDKSVTMGLMETYALNALVTDSAAAASAWGAGVRIMNGAVNEYPDGTKLRHIGGLVKESGRAVGLVTTTTVTHATPAGFASNAPSRQMEPIIAPQYRDVVDIVMGGGNRFFDAAHRQDGHDLYADYARSGYRIARTRDEMKAAAWEEKILGIFSESHLPYTVDRDQSADMQRDVPTLAEMTTVALEALARKPNGFLLQVEGGRVDHAAHGNDAAALIHDQIAFDDAIAVVVDWARRRGDTLVIMTSDHANANPGLTYYDRSFDLFDNLSKVKGNLWTMIDAAREGGNQPTAGRVLEVVQEIGGFEITEDDAQLLADALAGNPPRVINSDMRSTNSIFGQVLGNYTGVHFMATSHTEDYVLVSALGPGQEHFQGLIKNTKCYDVMTDLFDIRYRNPVMTLEEARRHAAPVGTPPLAPLF